MDAERSSSAGDETQAARPGAAIDLTRRGLPKANHAAHAILSECACGMWLIGRDRCEGNQAYVAADEFDNVHENWPQTAATRAAPNQRFVTG